MDKEAPVVSTLDELYDIIVAANLSEDEALEVYHFLKKHWNWSGTLWTEGDVDDEIRYRLEQDAEGSHDWSDEEFDQHINVIRGRIVHDKIWSRYFPDLLVEKGGAQLEDVVLSEVRLYLGELKNTHETLID